DASCPHGNHQITPKDLLNALTLFPDIADEIVKQIATDEGEDYSGISGSSAGGASIDSLCYEYYAGDPGDVYIDDKGQQYSSANPADDPDRGSGLSKLKVLPVVINAKKKKAPKAAKAHNTLQNILGTVASGLGTYVGSKKA